MSNEGPIVITGANPAPPVAGGMGSLLGSAPVVGGIVSGGLGLLGGILGNRSAAKAAKAQMDFQERMRATQYQTAVDDLRKAGLNPMLAYTQGGAGTPSGAQAQVRDPISPGISSAISGATAVAQMANVMADTKNKDATTANIDADTESKVQAAVLSRWLASKAKYESVSSAAKSEVDWETKDDAIKGIRAGVRLRQLEIPEAEATAKMYQGPAGEIAKYLGPIRQIMDLIFPRGAR